MLDPSCLQVSAWYENANARAHVVSAWYENDSHVVSDSSESSEF